MREIEEKLEQGNAEIKLNKKTGEDEENEFEVRREGKRGTSMRAGKERVGERWTQKGLRTGKRKQKSIKTEMETEKNNR